VVRVQDDRDARQFVLNTALTSYDEILDAIRSKDKMPADLTNQGAAPLSMPEDALYLMMEGIVTALSDRPHLSQAEKQTRANAAWPMISSFQPENSVQMVLAGQSLIFSDLVADAARDVTRGVPAPLKPKAQSNVIAMNREFHKTLRLFLSEQQKSMTERDEAREASEQRQAQPDPIVATPPAEPPSGAPRQEPVPLEAPVPEETSWLDEPTVTWVVETPAEAHAREVAEREALARGRDRDADVSHAETAGALVEPVPMRAERAMTPELVGA
jgi:hypothetical protein